MRETAKKGLVSGQWSSTVKVGVLAVVSLCLLVFVMVWLRGKGFSTGETYEVFFKDVDGMREAAPVQMMGIRIGFVDAIQPVSLKGRYAVRIRFSVNHPEVTVPRGSRLSIEQSGIIGEKFLEITPPQLRSVLLTLREVPESPLVPGIPVRFVYADGVLEVGTIEKVEKSAENVSEDKETPHRFYYRITRPGVELPRNPVYELKQGPQGRYSLLIVPRDPILARAPARNLIFTVENPVRIKRFLEIQMESAEALKLTNDKITQLLSDETIATLSSTVKNTELLTARATDVLENANALLQVAGRDLDQLVDTSDHLAKNLIEVSDNLNDVIGDPQLKQDILQTVSAIQESSQALSEIIRDPALEQTLALAQDTSRDASELVAILKKTVQDRDIQERLDTSLTLLNGSLDKLSRVLTSVDELTGDKDATLKGIIQDTRETTTNLKHFSEKLNGRFALFRLMF